MIMGHEVTGRVEALGEGVDSLEVGDLVIVFNIVSCGKCSFCVAKKEQLCQTKLIIGVNAGQWGAMAEYFVFPAEGLFHLGEGLDPAVGLLAEPIGVGIHAIGLMDPAEDDVIAIVGAGMIGTGLAIALKDRGVKRFFAVDLLAEKLAVVEQFGAESIQIGRQDPSGIIRDATDGAGAKGAFEAVGKSETVRMAYDLCAPGGTVVVIGNLAQEFTLPLQGVTTSEMVIRGSYGFTKKDFSSAVDLINSKSIPLDQLITNSCSLEEAPEALAKLARNELQEVKMVIRP